MGLWRCRKGLRARLCAEASPYMLELPSDCRCAEGGAIAARAAAPPQLQLYVSFMVVGAASGWFLTGALLNLLANQREVQRGGRMYGTFAIAQGIVGISSALVYGAYVIASEGLSRRTGQRGTLCLLTTTVLCFLALAAFWDAGAPDYPVVVLAFILGNVVGCGTLYVVYPMISVSYGGWLVAPVRAGADAATMLASLVAEAQNPSGSRNLFDMRLVFFAYAALSSVGVGLWLHVVRRGLGLRCEAGCDGAEEAEQSPEGAGRWRRRCAWMGWQLRGFAAPAAMLPPIALAVTSQVAQWALVTNLGAIGASMTDPEGCEGTAGPWVYRTSLTLSQVLLPAGALASSLGRCPRGLHALLALLQCACAGAVCLAAAGAGRRLWRTPPGQCAFTVAFGATACLEGYVVTMCYRYIGDCETVSGRLRQSSTNLLSLLAVLAVNPLAIVFGSLVSAGQIACTPL